MRFAALGRTQVLHRAISACVQAGHEPVFIATASAAPEYTADVEDFRALAAELGCPFASDGPLDAGALRESGAEIAISVNWPTLVQREVRDTFTHGVVNAHAGDLPRFRGNACPNWAILVGEERVVVTLHQMADELDAGPVLLKSALGLDDDTYIGDIYVWLEKTVPQLFADVLDGLEAGTVEPQPQPKDPALALRCYPRRPEDGRIDWGAGAGELARLVRASAEPFAGAFAELDGRRVTIWRARAADLPLPGLGVPGQVVAIDVPGGEVGVLTGDARQLVLEEIELPDEEWRGRPAKRIGSTRARLT